METIKAWRRRGLGYKEIAKKIDVNITTICDWKKRFPQFSEALKEGKETAIAKVENTLFKAATEGFEVEEIITEIRDGKKYIKKIKRQIPPDKSAMMFYLKCQSDWREVKQDVPEDADGGGLKISIDWNRDKK